MFEFVFYLGAFSQKLEFVRERIEIHAGDSLCSLNGRYYFKNNESYAMERTLFYPFAVNDGLPFPDSVFVRDLESGALVPFMRSGDGVIFAINIPPQAEKGYDVVYCQRTPQFTIEYLLTTTQKWGKPLERGEYVVHLPVSHKLKYISMNYDTSEEHDGEIVYMICRDNFMPEENLIVQWEREIK